MELVFVVERNVSVREAITRLVEAEGLVASPLEGVETLLRRRTSDARACAVIDVSDARAWRAETRAGLALMSATVPIIALDGSDGLAIRRIARRIGAAAYFRTPIDGPALIDAIHWALWSERVPLMRIEGAPPERRDEGTDDANDDPPGSMGPA